MLARGGRDRGRAAAVREIGMANFDADTLRELRDVRELRIRTGKHSKTAVVIWIVVADEEVFVRSWLGARGRWYRDLAAGGPATLEFAGRRIEVQAFAARHRERRLGLFPGLPRPDPQPSDRQVAAAAALDLLAENLEVE